MVDNQPYEIVTRQMIERFGEGLRETDPDHKAWGSVWLVDPFPAAAPDDPSADIDGMGILPLLLKLFTAMRGQSNFQAQGLLGENAQLTTLSRMTIAPVRSIEPYQQTALASAPLGGFGGVIDEQLREHDYLLGRRNCQDFLKSTFVMRRGDMKNNPIFSCVVSDGDSNERIPIIPLCGTAAEDCELPDWPSYRAVSIPLIAADMSKNVAIRSEKALDVVFTNTGIKDLINAVLGATSAKSKVDVSAMSRAGFHLPGVTDILSYDAIVLALSLLIAKVVDSVISNLLSTIFPKV